jgi:hypothetical protein
MRDCRNSRSVATLMNVNMVNCSLTITTIAPSFQISNTVVQLCRTLLANTMIYHARLAQAHTEFATIVFVIMSDTKAA